MIARAGSAYPSLTSADSTGKPSARQAAMPPIISFTAKPSSDRRSSARVEPLHALDQQYVTSTRSPGSSAVVAARIRPHGRLTAPGRCASANGRVSFAELGRRVGLSAPAVTERVRRLESAGVIRGYRAEVDLAGVGLPILALARIRYPSGDYRPFHQAVAAREEVIECHHVTGDDYFVVKIAARSMPHLERVTADLARFGAIATSVVYSTPIPRRSVAPPPPDRQHLSRGSDARLT